MRTLINLMSIDEPFREKLISFGLASLQNCSDAENQQFAAMKSIGQRIPADIIPDDNERDKFKRIQMSDQAPEDDICIIEYLKLREVAKIRGWVTFFGVLTLISLAVSIFVLLS